MRRAGTDGEPEGTKDHASRAHVCTPWISGDTPYVNQMFIGYGSGPGLHGYDGGRLGSGAEIAGPAVIEEETTTILLLPGMRGSTDAQGSYGVSTGGA